MPNGAQALMKTLVDAGVEVCFTNPGTSEMHFVAALDSEPRMRAVLALFEGVATGAADGIGWATAQRFAADGCRVVIADLREALAAARAAELGADAARLEHAFAVQLAVPASVQEHSPAAPVCST